MRDDTRFHTSDMALVAYLSTQHFSNCAVDVIDSSVTWFYVDGEALQRELEVYRREEARVEPKQFMLQVARVRREMHAVYDAV